MLIGCYFVSLACTKHFLCVLFCRKEKEKEKRKKEEEKKRKKEA